MYVSLCEPSEQLGSPGPSAKPAGGGSVFMDPKVGFRAVTQGDDAVEILGVPRAALLRHAMQQVSAAARGAIAGMEFTAGATLVNMGMNFQTVVWRASMRDPGLPAATGVIPVWRGEIADVAGEYREA